MYAKEIDITTNISPTKIPHQSNAVFMAFFQQDLDKNTVYTNILGKFSYSSNNGNKYIILLYHYYNHTILAVSMQSCLDKKALIVYKFSMIF